MRWGSHPTRPPSSWLTTINVRSQKSLCRFVHYRVLKHCLSLSIAVRGFQPRSFTKIAYSEQLFEVSWIPPVNEHLVHNYTVFWCRSDNNRDRPYQVGFKYVLASENKLTLIRLFLFFLALIVRRLSGLADRAKA